MNEHLGARTPDRGVVGSPPPCAATGIAGLDAILGGGVAADHLYLVQGDPGAGKTTLGLQFAMAGAQRGQRVLYVSTAESEEEVREIARSHGWSLDGVRLHYHDTREYLDDETGQSVFHPAEAELPKTMAGLLSVIGEVDPQRLVIDSLSEIRLLATDARWYRRQVLALKEDLAQRRCTTLLCVDRQEADQPLQSLAHGVINLEQLAPDYGPDRRRLRVAKLRGHCFVTGYHDFRIRTGGIDVYPRLVAAEHRAEFEPELVPSGVAELDALFGGGIDRGTSTLLLGPAGTGKSAIATQFAVSAARRGQHAVMYIFDERIQTLLQRAEGLGLGLQQYVDEGTIEVRQIDPAELTPGQFSQDVRCAVVEREARLVVIDSLNGYLQAMPEERLLVTYLHELFSFLGQKAVTVLSVMAQHGLPGAAGHTPVDLSYISDTVLLFRHFEYAGEVRKALSVYKRRSGAHEQTIRELQLGPAGVQIGRPLREFHGILTGVPRFVGEELPHVRADERPVGRGEQRPA